MGLTLYQLVSSADISKPVRLRLGWTKLLDTLMVFMKDFLEKKGLLLKKKQPRRRQKSCNELKMTLFAFPFLNCKPLVSLSDSTYYMAFHSG